MPLIKALPTLTDLTILAIAESVDILCEPYYKKWEELDDSQRPRDGPFGQMEDALLLRIFEKLKQTGALRTRHLRIFILENLNSFEFTSTTGISANKAISFLSARCRNLQELVLLTHPSSPLETGLISANISREIMIPAIVDWRRLQVLHFYKYNITDDVVVYIATHCSRLRSLNLRATKVTDQGVFALKLGDQENLINTKFAARSVVDYTLEYLDIRQTKTTSKSVRKLTQLLNLRTLLSDCLLEVLLDIWKEIVQSEFSINTAPFFPFTAITQEFAKKYTDQPVPKNAITTAVRMCRFANQVILDKTPNYMFNNRLRHLSLLNITKLEIRCKEKFSKESFQELSILLNTRGEMITELRLEHFAKVDLHFLGERCPRVTNLVLLNNTFTPTPIDQDFFKALTTLNIGSWRLIKITSARMNEIPYISPTNLTILFNRPNLETVKLVHQNQVTNDVLFQVLQPTNLYNLKSLFLISCNNVTLQGIWGLVTVTNALKTLQFMDCKRIFPNDVMNLKKYVKSHNLDLEINVLDGYYSYWFWRS